MYGKKPIKFELGLQYQHMKIFVREAVNMLIINADILSDFKLFLTVFQCILMDGEKHKNK